MGPYILSLLILATFAAVESTFANHPNVLVIVADDLDYGDLHSCNGKRGRIPTLRLNRLAALGCDSPMRL
jgi:hypothetical protein